MTPCKSCGADIEWVGILYPTRLLCFCEFKPRCLYCQSESRVVEFQKPIKSREPMLPRVSNSVAQFYCKDHLPFCWPKDKKAKLKRKQLPQVDPAWASKFHPPGSQSSQLVICFKCGDKHAMKNRVMFNGSESQCSRCLELMYTLAM